MADHDPRPNDPDQPSAPAADPVADPALADPGSDPVILPEPEPARVDEAEILASLPPSPPQEPQFSARDSFSASASAEPPAESAQPVPVATPPARRGGLVGVVVGGVIAAGLGFGLAQVVPQGWPIAATADLQPLLDAQAAELATVKAQLTELAARPTGIGEDQLAPVAAAAQSAESAAGAAADAAAALDPRMVALEDRIAALENRPAADGGASPAALAAYDNELAALSAELEAQKGAGAALVSDVEAAAKAAETRLAEAEAQAAALKTEAEATARAAITAAAVARVQAALDSGAPFDGPLADLTTAGLEIPPLLAENAGGGLPTLTALQASFPDAARAALEASLRADMGESLTERLGSFLRSQTGVRSLVPREGTDPDAILSRAEAALAAEDLAAALQELAALPADGQAAMAPWVADAQRRLDATAAVATLATAAEAM